MLVDIIIPVFNNAPSLADLIDDCTALQHELNKKNHQMQLTFVDDGSADGSWGTLCCLKSKRPLVKMRLIKLAQNYGAVAASYTGIAMSHGDFTVVLAADRQERAGNILLMLERYYHTIANVIVGTRKERNDAPTTTLCASLFNRIMRRYFIPNLYKGGFDLCLMDGRARKALLDTYHTPSFWSYHLFTLSGLKIDQVPIIRHRRPHGRSQWTNSKKLRAMFNNIYPFVRRQGYLWLSLPLVVVTMISVLIMIVQFAVFDHAFWESIASSLGYLMMLMLGGYASYKLVRLRDEFNSFRPDFQVQQYIQ